MLGIESKWWYFVEMCWICAAQGAYQTKLKWNLFNEPLEEDLPVGFGIQFAFVIWWYTIVYQLSKNKWFQRISTWMCAKVLQGISIYFGTFNLCLCELSTNISSKFSRKFVVKNSSESYVWQSVGRRIQKITRII